mgnify:CR=1
PASSGLFCLYYVLRCPMKCPHIQGILGAFVVLIPINLYIYQLIVASS